MFLTFLYRSIKLKKPYKIVEKNVVAKSGMGKSFSTVLDEEESKKINTCLAICNYWNSIRFFLHGSSCRRERVANLMTCRKINFFVINWLAVIAFVHWITDFCFSRYSVSIKNTTKNREIIAMVEKNIAEINVMGIRLFMFSIIK